MRYNKLVRDKIPEYIMSKGEKPIFHVAEKDEYWLKLKEKLTEEVQEFLEAESIEEMADILEVIDAIIMFKGFDKAEIGKVMQKKYEERGGFEKGIILDES